MVEREGNDRIATCRVLLGAADGIQSAGRKQGWNERRSRVDRLKRYSAWSRQRTAMVNQLTNKTVATAGSIHARQYIKREEFLDEMYGWKPSIVLQQA
jgi:hypothetical protein